MDRDDKMIRYKFKALIEEKSFREKRKITYKEITKATGIGHTTLSALAAKPGYVTTTAILDKLCAFFECSTSDLIEYVPDRTPPKAKRK
jgi:putative transcriptional regulator